MTVRKSLLAGVLVAALLAGGTSASAVTADAAGPDRTVELLSGDRGEAAADDLAQVAQAQVVGSTLSVGQSLGPGQALVSPSGRYSLVLTTGGRLLVVLQPNRFNPAPVELFFVAAGNAGAWLRLQGDGNLVMYNTNGSVAENFRTVGSGATQLVMQDDRNLVLYAGSRVVINFDTRTLPIMSAGQALLSGDRLRSADGSTLVMQTDGNLVLYRAGRAVFQSGTRSGDNAGADAVLQADGNFVVYAGNRAVFNTGTRSTAEVGTVLELEQGVFRVLQGEETLFSVYGSAWRSSTLLPGQSLVPGDQRRSADGRNVLRMQTDGNLVQYRDGRAVFQTRTLGASPAVMQTDGNFVLYRFDLVRDRVTVPFQTRTNGNPGASLVLPNGTTNFQVRSTTGRVLYPR